jgi:ADP-ribose pyrophosphatase YjhB (NUDIX family)
VNLEDDLRTEGEPEREFHPGIAERMPRKRVAAAALIRDSDGRILFIDPTYKPDWVLPGGIVEAGEEPASGCARELLEELGLHREPGRLLVVDWVPAHGVWGDSLQFVFDGGLLQPGQAATLTLQAEEVRSAPLLRLEEAQPHLRPSLFRRIATASAALTTGHTSYLQFGRHP